MAKMKAVAFFRRNITVTFTIDRNQTRWADRHVGRERTIHINVTENKGAVFGTLLRENTKIVSVRGDPSIFVVEVQRAGHNIAGFQNEFTVHAAARRPNTLRAHVADEFNVDTVGTNVGRNLVDEVQDASGIVKDKLLVRGIGEDADASSSRVADVDGSEVSRTVNRRDEITDDRLNRAERRSREPRLVRRRRRVHRHADTLRTLEELENTRRCHRRGYRNLVRLGPHVDGVDRERRSNAFVRAELCGSRSSLRDSVDYFLPKEVNLISICNSHSEYTFSC